MASHTGRLTTYNRDHPGTSKPFIATVMPGYDDIKIRNGHRKDRANGDYYRGTWQTAIDHNAAAVVLTSFNEFFEGSHIEPSEQYGDTYLRLTKEWAAKYHTPPPPPPPHPTPPPPLPSGPPPRRRTKEWPAKSHPAPPPPPQTAGPCRLFAETGQQVCGRILEYWNQ